MWRTLPSDSLRLAVSLLVAGLSIASAAVAAAGAPTAPPPLVGVAESGGRWALRPLDPRTLAPLPGGWEQPVARNATVVRSPLGRGVAAMWDVPDAGRKGGRWSGTIVVSTRTGTVLRRQREAIGDGDLYWSGGEAPAKRGGAIILDAYQDSGSQGYGYSFGDAVSGNGDGILTAGSFAAVAEGLALFFVDPEEIDIADGIKSNGIFYPVVAPLHDAFGSEGLYQLVADVAHDRLYIPSTSGLVTEIDQLGGRHTISYHPVTLKDASFGAAWAGQGRIALWGEDGLGTIDTRTWTTNAISTDQMALPTPFGIVAWTYDAPGGISVFRPDGSRRFTVFADTTIPSWGGVRGLGPIAVGPYLYVVAGDHHRYAIDLRTGHLVGRTRDGVRLAAPSYVPIP